MKAGKTTNLQSSLKTYLFGIAQNLILKVHRKEEVNSRHETRLSEHWIFQSQPMESLDHLLNKTAGIIRQLKEPCRSIIRSFYMESMSLSEIAEQMNYNSTDVVKSQKSRCLKKMKELADVLARG